MRTVYAKEIDLTHLFLLLNGNDLYPPLQISLRSNYLTSHYKLLIIFWKKTVKKMIFLKIFSSTLLAMPMMILHLVNLSLHPLVFFGQHLTSQRLRSKMPPQRVLTILQVKKNQLPNHKRHPSQNFSVY